MRRHALVSLAVAALGTSYGALAAPPAASPGGAATSTPTAPTALWIPQQGKGQGIWLLLSADHRVLREGGLKELYTFKSFKGQTLPAPAQDLKGRWGYLDAQGQWALAPTFEAARNFAEEDGLARFKHNGLWGFIGTDLKVQIKPTWPKVGAFSQGRATVQGKDEKWGVIDDSGAVVLPSTYRLIGPFGKVGLARAATDDNQWVYIDRQGATRFRAGKNPVRDFGDFEIAPVNADGKWGLMDAKGTWAVKPTFEYLHEFQAPGLAVFKRNHKTGYIDQQGREVIPAGDISETIGQGLIRAGSPGSSRFSFIDVSGKTAIAGPFDWVGDFGSEGATPSRRSGQWGLLNAKGQWVSAGELREPLRVDKLGLRKLQRGLSTWLHAGQALEWKTDQGQTVYRLTQKTVPSTKQVVLQLQTGDKLIWTSQPQSDPLNLTPFFDPRPQDLMRFADAALIGEARRLLTAPLRDFLPYSLVFRSRSSPYDLNDLDDDEKAEVKQGGMSTLAESYVDEGEWGSYYFLSNQRGRVFKAIIDRTCSTLQAALGVPLPAPKANAPLLQGRTQHCAWQQGDRQLMVVDYFESGDGDFEHQVSLLVLPVR